MSIDQTDIDMHQHDFLELAYITKGRALHTINDTETVVEKGNYFIINYGTAHKYTLINNQNFHLVNILFKPEFIDKSLKNCQSFLDLINHYLIRIDYATLEKKPTEVIFNDSDSTILNLINRMYQEYENKNPGYAEVLRCHLIEIIIYTLRKISKTQHGFSENSCSARIKEYIEKNYMNPVTLNDICKELNFSLSYMSRRFKQETGYSFVDYLQRKRMEQSGRLLANTDKKISEIAELVGYRDVKFFGKVFKSHWGMAPGEFRKSYK
ncbi:MAG TPA: AraC family transcriptional regulator [Candidatus Avimonas sp.]|nr:AraC family transcriptional regulator [Candidatus Avimonas sp.]